MFKQQASSRVLRVAPDLGEKREEGGETEGAAAWEQTMEGQYTNKLGFE